MKWKGHEYFGQWYATHDPSIHDAITGPVDIFDTNGAGLGYAEAVAGEGFIRIGVGVVEKPEEPSYRGTHTYKILDTGKRTTQRNRTSIRFNQDLSGPNGYGYSYSKRITLPPGRAEMVISYNLRNTGTKPIDTTVFNHGFFQLDAEPAGPGLIWNFPWKPRATDDLSGMAEIRDFRILYIRELRDGERLLTTLLGYGDLAADHAFSVQNEKTGAGVRVTADQPIRKLNFWSRRLAYSRKLLYIFTSRRAREDLANEVQFLFDTRETLALSSVRR
ncbi:MAG: hypothetical protein WKF37_20565 [Bryobacteraceae bacterium]